MFNQFTAAKSMYPIVVSRSLSPKRRCSFEGVAGAFRGQNYFVHDVLYIAPCFRDLTPLNSRTAVRAVKKVTLFY